MPLLSCIDALELIAAKRSALTPPPATERLALHRSLHRVLAQTITADRDQPPFPRSTRDGYAVRAADTRSSLRLIGAIRAGEQWVGPPPQAGEAIEIMTGAPVPAGADAVVMLEHVTLSDDVLQ